MMVGKNLPESFFRKEGLNVISSYCKGGLRRIRTALSRAPWHVSLYLPVLSGWFDGTWMIDNEIIICHEIGFDRDVF